MCRVSVVQVFVRRQTARYYTLHTCTRVAVRSADVCGVVFQMPMCVVQMSMCVVQMSICVVQMSMCAVQMCEV